MLGRLILLLLQIAIGWFGTNAIMGHIPVGGLLELFVFAVVAAIIVFLIGVIAALVIKDIGSPSSRTLTWALAFALIAAALWQFGPQLPLLSEVPWGKIPAAYAVLAGAILGYSLRR
jgi:hypothetical protein